MLTETENKIQAKRASTIWVKLGRFVLVCVTAYFVGQFLSRSANAIDNSLTPAGFSTGVLHGAMMPCAMPNLILGKDVAIYARNNTGRPYKLGYTVGVNLCGLAFFGISFHRLWRRKQAEASR